MLRLLRRFAVLAVLMFWQGGFLFYAAVVVPIGADVLQSHTKQGFITRQVTNWLNVAGAIGLAVLLWDLLVAAEPRRWLRWLRWAAWIVALVSLLALVILHERLDELLQPAQFQILDREQYRDLHRFYLWTSTVQWGALIVWLLLTLGTWQGEDEAARS
jgi:hypothetical protein